MDSKVLTLGLLLIASMVLSAQKTEVLQVVSKEIKQSFPYSSGYELNIEGEKADVSVDSWNESKVEVTITLAAKNKNKATASSDLELMQYSMEQVGQKIYLRNYLKVPEGHPSPTSQLEFKYVIKVPAECPVYLKSKFGLVQVSDLTNSIKLRSKFSDIGLQNIKGTIEAETRFGDLKGAYIDGTMLVNSRRTNIALSELKGKFDLTTHYGILDFRADPNVADLKLVANNTRVFLSSSDLERFAYNIEATDSRLQIPDNLGTQFYDASNDPEIQKLSYRPEKEYYANFTIVLTFSELTLSTNR